MDPEREEPFQEDLSFLDVVKTSSNQEEDMISGDTVDTFVKNISETIAYEQKKHGEHLLIAKYTVKELAHSVFNIGSGVVKADMTTFNLAEIKSMVENIDENVEIILRTPLQLSLDNLDEAINLIKTGHIDMAVELFRSVHINAQKAFQYTGRRAKDQKMFRLTIASLQLMICSKVAMMTY